MFFNVINDFLCHNSAFLCHNFAFLCHNLDRFFFPLCGLIYPIIMRNMSFSIIIITSFLSEKFINFCLIILI